MIEKYDVLVLGSGPAGFYSALTCAGGGLKTAIVENSIPGGTGLAKGCLPVKVLLDKIRIIRNMENLAASLGSEFNTSDFYKEAFRDICSHGTNVSDLEKKRFLKAGIDFYQSNGRFLDKNTYEIDQGKISAEKIIIATGTEPGLIDGNTFNSRLINHSNVFNMGSIPEHLTIIGGDVEGVEFASLFSYLGTKVRIIEQMPDILPGYDRDLAAPIISELKKRKVELFCSSKVTKINEGKHELSIVTENNIFQTPVVLITGIRKPSIPNGLEDLGLEIKDGFIKVDDHFKSSIPGIYAVGDINGILGMAGVAVQQAVQLGDYLLKGTEIHSEYSILPRAVFTIPGICGGGMQEKEIESPDDYQIKIFPLNQCWRTMHSASAEDFVKIIIDKNGIVRGIWFVGDGVDSFGSSVAMYLKNKITLDEIRRDLYVHPTALESLFEVGLL